MGDAGSNPLAIIAAIVIGLVVIGFLLFWLFPQMFGLERSTTTAIVNSTPNLSSLGVIG